MDQIRSAATSLGTPGRYQVGHLNSLWHKCSMALGTFLKDFECSAPANPKCVLRSGNGEGILNAVSSLSYSRNQFKMI